MISPAATEEQISIAHSSTSTHWLLAASISYPGKQLHSNPPSVLSQILLAGIQINQIFNIDMDIAIFEKSLLILLKQYIAQSIYWPYWNFLIKIDLDLYCSFWKVNIYIDVGNIDILLQYVSQQFIDLYPWLLSPHGELVASHSLISRHSKLSNVEFGSMMNPGRQAQSKPPSTLKHWVRFL